MTIVSAVFRVFIAGIVLISQPHAAGAQTVTESWLRTATSSCGGGQFVEVEGEFEATLFKMLGLVSGGTSGEGVYQLNDVEKILSQFEGDSKERIYRHYQDCLLQLIRIAATPVGIPPQEIVLDSNIAPPQLAIVPKGKRFMLKEGDLVALGSAEMLLSFVRSGSHGSTFRFTNTLRGEADIFRDVKEGEVMNFNGCNVIPYELNREEELAALLSVCE